MNFFKAVNIWQSYKQERDYFVHFLRLLAVRWPIVAYPARLINTCTFLQKVVLCSGGQVPPVVRKWSNLLHNVSA